MKDTYRVLAAVAAMTVAPIIAVADDVADTNRDLVVTAITELFIDGDLTAIDRYWSEDYLQHNPMVPSGRSNLKSLFGNMPTDFKYEIGMVIADDDKVAIHGRYVGIAPTPMIAVDIFRVEDGLIAEHWDVLQAEVSDTASGLPMFSPTE